MALVKIDNDEDEISLVEIGEMMQELDKSTRRRLESIDVDRPTVEDFCWLLDTMNEIKLAQNEINS